MNINNPTIEDIKRELNNCYGWGVDEMVNEILNNGPRKDKLLNDIKSTLADNVKYSKGASIKQYYRNCNKITINYLETGEIKSIDEIETPKQTKKVEVLSKSNIMLVMNTLKELGMLSYSTKDIQDVYNKINS